MMALAFLLSVSALSADETWEATAEVSFSGTSTLHDFEGTGAPKDFTITVNGESRASFKAVLPVKTLDTDNKRRDKKMREMFRADKHPNILGKAENVPVAAMKPGDGPGKLPVRFTIAGTSKELDTDVSNWQQEDGKISFDVVFSVSLKSFKLKAPSLLGVFKVGDQVGVSVHVEAKRK